mmetsp:Transcript_36983/g.56658  ORF Transcript_36983/g.56658 Transcript_36983/m.56658 type:complete len:96 (+) Transcript_36983:446-733(+)
MEHVKDDISARYKTELTAKNSEMQRLEGIYQERIDNLQAEVNKLHVQLKSQMEIEKELREKSDAHRKKAEELQLAVHKSQDVERKELIELQIKLS